MKPLPIKVNRRWGKRFLIAAGALTLFLLAAAWYTTTDSFHGWLRNHVVVALQDATGGKVELGAFHMIPFRLRAEARDLTIHGTEATGSIPLGHADAVVAQVRLLPLLGGQIALSRLILEHPVVRINFAPDGSSNIPTPKGPVDPRSAPEQLFDMSIDHLEVHNGALLWNDQRIPVDFAASGVAGGMTHSLFRRRYEGKVHLEKVDTKLEDYRAFAWGGDLEFGLTRHRLDIKSLSLTSGRSRLRFNGEVLDFVHPQISGNYEAQLEIADTGSVTRTKELAGGTADIRGEGKWTEASFSITGKLNVRDGLWKMDNGGIRVASGSTQYSLTDRLEFRDLQAKALGGEIKGDVKVNHWLVAATDKKHEGSVGEVHLQLRDLAVGDLLSLLNSKDLPIDSLHAVGTASGTLASQWKRRIETADTEVDLTASAPPLAATGTLPIAGTAHGTYPVSYTHLTLPTKRIV